MSSFITPTVRLLHPNYVEPGVIWQQTQQTGAFEVLAGGDPLVRLSNTSRMVYAKTGNITTRVHVGQSATNSLPSVDVRMGMVGTATYLQQVRQEFDAHDADMSSEWGVGILEVFRRGTGQAHAQSLRNLLLHGAMPQNGEGLLNAPNATTIVLPTDSSGNQTIESYDPNEMFTFLLGVIADIKNRTMQAGIGRRIVLLAPQRVITQLTIRSIVQVTQWQRAGAGTNVVGGAMKEVLSMGDDEFELQADDTLMGAGQNGSDAVIVTMPEITAPEASNYNTNEFAKIAPGLDACNLQFVNSPAPIEVISPIESGRTDFLTWMRVTSGWPIRQEALTIISMPTASSVI